MATSNSHLVWASGHIIMLACTLRVAIASPSLLFGGSISGFWYKAAYTGALLSYLIVVYKSLGPPPSPTSPAFMAYAQRAMMDDNVQYAVLGVWWGLGKRVYVSLIPFAIFSVFHVLTFFRTGVLPHLLSTTPIGPPPAAGGRALSQYDKVNRYIQQWTKHNYDNAMRLVAYVEIAILLYTILRMVTFSGSYLTPLFLILFLRMRYFSSPFTRTAVTNVLAMSDNFMSTRAPPAVNGAWVQARDFVGGYLGGMVQQPPAGAPAAGGAGRGGGAAGRGGAAAGRR